MDEGNRGALALRALAHPLRWKLIDLLGSEESATATRCAEVLGESVPSCAYHLGILAKYGYIELVPGQAGREKPWRLASYKQVLSGEGLGIEGELAAEAATDAFLDHEVARIKQTWRRRSHEDPGWRDAIGLLGSTFWATEAELAEVTEQLTEIALRYSDRLQDPGKRPEGARLARVFFSTSVAPVRQPQAPAISRGQG
jgi:Helix-turn-helix domain